MDPITLAIAAALLNVGPAVAAIAPVVGPAAASVGPAAAGAAATAPVWVPAAGTGLAVGSVGAGAAGAAGVASNPVATQGVEAVFNDINNQAVIGSVEANNFVADGLNPHLPPEHQIPKRTIGY